MTAPRTPFRPFSKLTLAQPWQRALVALLWSAACQACYTREPARETPPPPESPLPERTLPAPGATPTPAPPPTPRSSGEVPAKGSAPADDSAGPSAPRATPKPAAQRRGRAAPSAAPESEEAELGSTEPSSEAQRLLQRLGSAVNLSTPNCPAAQQRKRAICDLAEQICSLVDRDPNVASVAAYCDDARRRCSEAAERVSERCR